MSRHGQYLDETVKCPFYKYQLSNAIYCEGIEGCKYTSLTLSNKSKVRDWMEAYCCSSEYGQCKICLIVEEKYEQV